ncbi:MAG: aldo/keto reductase [Pseudomonadota bacterium]
MPTRRLGRTDLHVTQLCLGTMTWGSQNTQDEAFEQMDYALERGVTFWDTAEAYPVNPMSAETQGATETIIGNWFADRGRRDEVVLATKASGNGLSYVRDGKGFEGDRIAQALEGNLKRLQTDYVDLYQLHWPQRGSYHFRQSWSYDPSHVDTQETVDLMGENLRLLGRLVDEGKIRHIGLSNESVWGTAKWLQMAEAEGLPRMVSTQNEYSLLYRQHDTDWAELSHHEDVGLLSFSPLGAGLLTGKYLNGAIPKGSRLDINKTLGGRHVPSAHEAVAAYKAVADKHGLDLTQMSLAWCLTRPFMTSAIFGATTMEQLKTAIDSVDVTLSDDVMEDIAATWRQHSWPM